MKAWNDKHGLGLVVAVTVGWALWSAQLVAGGLQNGCDIVLPEMECKAPNGADLMDSNKSDNNMERFNEVVAFGIEFVSGALIGAISTQVPGVGFAYQSFKGLIKLFSPQSDPVDDLRKELLLMMEDALYENTFSDDVKTLKLAIVAAVGDIKDYEIQNSETGKLAQLRYAREHCEDFHTMLHSEDFMPEARLAVLYEYCGICSMVYAESIAAEPTNNLIEEERGELLENCANYAPTLVPLAKKNQEAFLPSKVESTTNNDICFLFSYQGKWNFFARHGARKIVSFNNRGRCVAWLLVPGVPLSCEDSATEFRNFTKETMKCIDRYNVHFKHINAQVYQQRVLTPSVYYKAALNETLATDTIRIRLTGSKRILTLCEVKIYGVDGMHIPLFKPSESSNYYEGIDPDDAYKALDGSYIRDPPNEHISCTRTTESTNPWWEAKFALGGQSIGKIVIVNREVCQKRLAGAQVLINGKQVHRIGDGSQDEYTIFPHYKIKTSLGLYLETIPTTAAPTTASPTTVAPTTAGPTVTPGSPSATPATASPTTDDPTTHGGNDQLIVPATRSTSLFQFLPSGGAIAIKARNINSYLSEKDGVILAQTSYFNGSGHFSMQYSGAAADGYFIKNNKSQKYLSWTPGSVNTVFGLDALIGLDQPAWIVSWTSSFTLELQTCDECSAISDDGGNNNANAQQGAGNPNDNTQQGAGNPNQGAGNNGNNNGAGNQQTEKGDTATGNVDEGFPTGSMADTTNTNFNESFCIFDQDDADMDDHGGTPSSAPTAVIGSSMSERTEPPSDTIIINTSAPTSSTCPVFNNHFILSAFCSGATVRLPLYSLLLAWLAARS